jgi:fatty acid/phospholipid biosynthesis enzyme
VIAVDANGADQGPAAVAQGVARSGLPVLLFGPAAEISDVAGPHAEIVDAPETIKAGGEPTRSSPPVAPGRRWRPPRWR